MQLRKKFISDFLEASEFDAIGLCYMELKKNKPDAKIGFVSDYIQKIYNESNKDGDSDSIRFESLRNSLKNTAIISQEHQGESEKLNMYLLREVADFRLPKKYDKKVSVAIIMFYLIEAVDYYLQLNMQYLDEFRQTDNHGPGNNGISRKSCLVYLKCTKSFLDGAYKGSIAIKGSEKQTKNKKYFRKQLKGKYIGDVFSAVQIIDKDRMIGDSGVPQIVRVNPGEKIKKDIKVSKSINIAAIPFIGYETFHFRERGSKDYCKERDNLKGSFYIEYMPELEKENMERVIQLLEKAILEGANIVVFPEFIMSPFMRKSIAEYLGRLKKTDRLDLIMVLAGTTYDFHEPDKGNNILYILNARGAEIARYYKYSPFNKDNEQDTSSKEKVNVQDTSSEEMDNEQDTSSEEKEDNSKVYFENMEILSDPGKECTLLDVDEIGRILPAVCRDVVDGVYTNNLVAMFSPQLLLIPAWSSSVGSFNTFMKYYADTIHTSSVLCNCCDAVSHQSDIGLKKIGMFCIPEKKGSFMNAEPKSFDRSNECREKCRSTGGCVFMLNLNYLSGKPQITTKQICISSQNT